MNTSINIQPLNYSSEANLSSIKSHMRHRHKVASITLQMYPISSDISAQTYVNIKVI